MSIFVEEIEFVDPITLKVFKAKPIQLKTGQKAFLAPLWVKSTPQQWLKPKDGLERDS